MSRVKFTLNLLRNHYNSTLPAEIFHFPSERPTEEDPIREELERLGAVLVEATGRVKDVKRTKNFHLVRSVPIYLLLDRFL